MKISRRTCLSSLVALGLTACFGSASPLQVIEDFYAAVADGNTDKALKYLALESVSANEMTMVQAKVQMMVAQGKTKIDANGGIAKIEVIDERKAEDGQSAQMRVRMTFKNDKTSEENFKMVQEKGDWKIRL